MDCPEKFRNRNNTSDTVWYGECRRHLWSHQVARHPTIQQPTAFVIVCALDPMKGIGSFSYSYQPRCETSINAPQAVVGVIQFLAMPMCTELLLTFQHLNPLHSSWLCWRNYITYRVVQKKLHNVCGTTFLQPYVTESCGFQQNVHKLIAYTTKVNIWMQQLNILCFAVGKWTIQQEN